MKMFLFFIATALLLFLIDISPGWSSEPLTPKWTREGLGYIGICKPGKLIIANNGPVEMLIDLTNGETIYQLKQDTEKGLRTNYLGDKFYFYIMSDLSSAQCYDVKTRKFLGKVVSTPESSDNSEAVFLANNSTFIIWNGVTNTTTDSVKIPNTPETGQVFTNWKWEYTPDSRYFALTLGQGITPYFYFWDRTTKEFLFQWNKDFTYCLFNKSNKMVYAENMKLAGDDTIYSYIRIYDPDQRKVVQDIKISKAKINNLIIRMDDNFILYELNDDYNTKGVFNFINNQILNNNLKPIGSPFRYADSTIIIAAGTGFFCGNIYDWTTGIKDNTTNEDTVIYPNPTTNQVSINISEQFYSGTWQISDFTGKIMIKGIILPQNQLQINLSQLQPQTYFLTLMKDNIAKTFKIVKQ
jgi:hypothetical protein